MIPKFMPRPHSLHFIFLSPPRFFPKHYLFPQTLSLSPLAPAAAAATTTSTAVASLDEAYGPSLLKGYKFSHLHHHLQPPIAQPATTFHKPPHDHEVEDSDFIDTESFTRVYDISALRVPTEQCFALESCLRVHLLNWARIRNIARVPGDEVEDHLIKLLNDRTNCSSDDNNEITVHLNRRINGIAEGEVEKTRKKWIGKNEFAVLEVAEGEGEEEREELRGLLGNEFKGRKWRGSTRLLLLDERYAGKGLDQLPEAIKVLLFKDGSGYTEQSFELVRCKLTLFYDYWQMNEILEAILPKSMVVPSAFETVGHIAHLNLRDDHLPYKKLIAKVVLDKNKPKIQTVVNKVDFIHNDYRTMQLEVLAGNHSLVTEVVENGLRFHVDLASVYWNSRLATERQRLLNCFTCEDIACDVFAGVGPIAISAARKVRHVYANDLNPVAVDYMERNCILNKLERKIEVFNMDGRRFIDAIFGSQNTRSITQVVMNLPNDAAEYLDVFRGIFRTKPRDREITLPKIHVYGFSKAQDPEFDFYKRIGIALSEDAFEVEIRKVRLVAPGKWMLCASFLLPKSVAFAMTTSNV